MEIIREPEPETVTSELNRSELQRGLRQFWNEIEKITPMTASQLATSGSSYLIALLIKTPDYETHKIISLEDFPIRIWVPPSLFTMSPKKGSQILYLQKSSDNRYSISAEEVLDPHSNILVKPKQRILRPIDQKIVREAQRLLGQSRFQNS